MIADTVYVCPINGYEFKFRFNEESGWSVQMPRCNKEDRQKLRDSMKNIVWPEIPEEYREQIIEHQRQLLEVTRSVRIVNLNSEKSE